MKNLKKILSVLTLIVLVGSDFLTSISYALDDMLEDSVVVQTENEEETENVENEEYNVDEEDTEFAYEDESMEEGLETENSAGDIIEEGTGEVSEIGSGEIEELTEETVEGATGDIIKELTGEVIESTGTGEETVIEEIKYNEEPIIGEKTYNDVTVRVEALTGTFLEGTELVIKPIKWWNLSSLKDKLVEEKEEIEDDTTIVAFDITFKYEGEEVQPKEGEKVKVTFDYSKNENLLEADKNENQEVKVYHIEDMDNNGEKVNQGEEVVKDVTNKVESEEEGIAVVDAESFSIYAVVTTTGNPDSVTVTHYLNGGYWMEDHSTESKPIVYTCINNSCTTTTHYKTPSKDGYMFMGWINGSGNRRKDGVATDGMSVYAKWQKFGDLNVYILGSDNDSDKHQYTLMDRNMGALDIYNKSGTINDESRGYYYQWGNNYGFDSHYENSGALSETTKQKVDVANYSWEFPYYGYKFYLNGAKEYANWMSGSVNKSLWGDGNITSKEAKQGPCPAGYYIPSKNDWQGLLVSWNSVNSRAEKNFYFDFLVPSAGIRDRGYQQGNGSKVVDIERYRYASSSRNNNDTKTKAVITLTQTEMDKVPIVSPSSNNNNLSHERGSNGLSVRCFKNVTGSIINISDIDLNGGQKAIISIDSGEVVSLQNPVRNSDEFRGWYTTSNFSGNPIGVGSGLSVGDKLYARRCADGLVDDGTQCIDGYSITFDSNGGSPVATQTVSPLGTGTRPTDPTKMGYVFTGWFLTGAIEEFDFTGTQITGNITLYAHWNTGESYFKINCNKKKLDVDNNQLLDKSDPYLTGIVITGATDSEIILADYSNRCNLAGYEYTGAMVYGSDDGSGSKLSTTTLLADGTRVIEMYFQPVQNQFTLNSADYTITVGSSQNGLYYYGAKVTLSGDSSDDCFEWNEWNGLPEGTTSSAQTSFSMPNDSVTVTPSVKENTYNIIFSGNGSSSGEMSRINEVRCTESIQLTPNAFGKTGYTFTGWSRASGENTREYSDGQTVSGLSKTNLDNVTLYAVWDKNKYIVTGSVAEGQENMGYLSGNTSTGASLTGLYDFGTNLIFIAIPELGYVFDYWKNGDTILSGTDLGDGTNQLTVIVDQILDIIAFFKPAENTPYTVEHYKQNLTQDGYEFAWSGTMYGTTNGLTNATGTDYVGFTLSGNLVDYKTGINADGSTVVRLYYDRNTYTVTWNMWEGHGDWTKIDGNVPYGTTPIFEWDDEEDPYMPSRGRDVYTDDIKYDFIFTGWVRSGTVEIIKDLTTQIVTGNVTYTAQYDTGFRYYEVRYHPGEGTGTMVNNNLQLYISGNLNLNTFTKTGYEFSGWWYQYGDGIDIFYEDGQEINLGTDDGIKSDAERTDPLYLDLYAQWEPSTDTKFTVNCYARELDKNYKVLSPDPKYLTGKQHTGKTDSGIRIGDYRAECLIDGYDIGHGFSGAILYGSDLPSSGVETGDGGNTTILADGTRRIDVYIAPKLDRFVINLSENCGYKGDPSGDYYYGSKIYLEANPFECYSFSGWIGSGLPDGFDRSSPTTTFFMPHVSVLTVTPTVKENTYNITFSGNGSTSGTMSNLSVLCTSGTLSQNAFEREGYTFAGWSENPNGPVQFTSEGDVHRLSIESGGNVTLYAIWDINSYDVTGSVATGQENMGYLSGATSTGTSLTGLYEYGTELIFIAVPELGYLFDYWEVNNGTGDNLPDGVVASGNQLTVIVDQILDIIAHFKADVRTVTVNHYQMNIAGGYTLFETEGDFTGYVGSGFTAIEKEYSGFIASESNVKTITISGNEESNVINLYYDRESYNLRYYVDGIQTGNIEPYYFGQSISPRQKPTKEGYTFSGWDDVPSTMPAEDVNIYGSFITNKHWVRFYDDHNGNLILSGEYDYGTPGSSIITPNGSGLSKTGNTFSGWVGIPDYMPDYDVDVEAYWDLNFYTIRIKDTSGAVIKSGTYGYGLEVPLECPGMEWEREGYMMTGCTSSMIPEFMPDHDMDIIVRWLPIERNIEVRYHTMDTNGQYPREWSGIYYTGLTESVFRVPDYTTSGFSQDRENYPYQPTSLVVSGNESANVVDVYYKREKYWLDIHGISRLLPEIDSRVTFAEVIPNKGEFGKQYYFGEEITVNLLLNEGWNFMGWYDATDENMGFPPEEVSDLTSRNISFHMPAHDVKVEPLMEHIPYILSFTGYEGANISEYYPGVENQEVYYGYRAYLPFLEKDGYSFFGWKNEYGNYEWHTGDGYPSEPTLQSMPSHDYELIAVFLPRTDMPYRKDYYLQDIDGMGYTLNEDLREGDTNGVTDEPLPGRDDYKNIDGFQYTGFGYDENFLPIDQWPNIKATGDNYINYYYDRKIDSVYVEYDAKKMSILGTGEYRYGAPVTLTATVKTGYEFSGFTSDQGELLTSGSVYNFTMPDSHVYLYANADSIVYSIEYEMYGGWLTPYQWYKTGYTVDGDFDLDIFDAVKDGYIFLGWTGGEIGVRELTEPTTGLIIPLGSTGNRKYFANFEATGSNITVNYYLKKIDPENNVLIGGSDVYRESVIYTGLTDSVVDIQSLYGTGIEGYEYTTAIVYGSDLSGGVETGTTTILGDQSRIIDIYYTPKKYDFTVIAGPNTITSGTSISTGYYLGAYVTLSGDSTDNCFEWDKWGSSLWPEGVENESHTTFAMPAHNVTVESMVKEKSYNIIFNANGGIGTMEILPVQCTSGTLIANNFERNGYTFTGWSRNSGGPVEFTGETDVHRLSTESGGSVTLFAIWDANWYTVTFDLNGGSLTGDMTLTKDYTIETSSISLDGYIPVKNGYIFTGWYKSGTLVDHIAGGEIGDYTLKADWEADNQAVFVFDYLEKLEGGYDVIRNQPVLAKVDSFFEATIKSYTGFDFDETNPENVTGKIVSWDPGQNEIKVFYKRNNYPVVIRNQGEQESSVTTGGGDYLYEELVTVSVEALTGWEFVGWTKIQGNLSGADLSKKTISFNMPAEQVMISPIMDHIPYTVSFDSASGTVVEESQTYYYNDNLSGLDNAVTTRTGYDFDGWYFSGVLYTSGSIMPAENITLTAKWAPRTGIQYQVNHRGENTGDNNYEVLLSGYIMYGTSDTQTIAESGNFAGFTLSGDVEQEIIDPNGTTVVDIYYNRNVYSIILDNNGGTGVTELTGKYQVPLIVPNPTKSGYEFAGWNPELPMTIPNYDYTGIAMWNPSTGEYKVEFYYQLSDGTYPSIATSGESRIGTTEGIGSVTDVDKEPKMSGYVFDSTNTGNVLEGEIVGDGSLVLKVYFKKQFIVRYLAGSYGIFSEDIHTDLDYGIGTPAFRGNTGSHEPGYTFNGWFPEWTGIVTDDVDYEAQWRADTDTEFKVEYYLQNVEDDEYTFVETGLQTGTTDTTGYADTTKEFTGFAYSGENENNITSGVIAGDGSLVLKLYYDRNEYTVTTGEVENGSISGEVGSQRYGKRIRFTAHAAVGYRLKKWLRDGVEVLSGGVVWTGEELEIEVDTGMEIGAEFEARNDTPYYVEYYRENLDGGYDVWTGTYSGTTDQEATAQELTFTGFTYDSGNVDNITTGNIDGDGSRVLKLYYNREIYTITWLNEDGTDMDTTTVKYGEVPTHAVPIQPADAHYTYEFAGWDPEPTAATGGVSYRATYNYIVNKYTITWRNDDGILIDTTEVEYGVVPTHANPRKADTEDYRYTFVGWTPNLVAVVGDAEYTATFTAEEKEKPSKGGNMSGGGGRKSNTDDSDNKHGSAEENSDGFTGDVDNNTGNVDGETLSLYQWARENDITTMDTLEEANPEGLLTRGHMAKMVVNFVENVLGKPVPTIYPDKCNWKDKESERESQEIKIYAKKACSLGLMGIYVEEFMPNKILDRAEFGTIVSRLLWGDRYNILDTDYRSYYEDHLWALKRHGILTQTDNPEDRWEIRKWVWLVFRRISEKLNK